MPPSLKRLRDFEVRAPPIPHTKTLLPPQASRHVRAAVAPLLLRTMQRTQSRLRAAHKEHHALAAKRSTRESGKWVKTAQDIRRFCYDYHTALVI